MIRWWILRNCFGIRRRSWGFDFVLYLYTMMFLASRFHWLVEVIYNKEYPTESMIESKLNDIIYPLLQVLGVKLIIPGLILFIIKL
jgi:hypothetical protein